MLDHYTYEISKAVDALERDFNAWQVARIHAKQAGAITDVFASQENEALVGRIFDSLSKSRTRAANIGKEISRISVFM